MRLARFLPVYGGKRSIAHLYPKPEFPKIIECFAGVAGYSLLHHERDVHLYDADERVIAVWQYLIGASSRDILQIPVDIEHVDELPGKFGDDVRWLVGWWMQPAGSKGPAKSRSSWALSHAGSTDVWSERCRERLAGQVESIRHWHAECKPYTDLDARREATWFVDPPYQIMGQHYRESANAIDYEFLGAWCRTLRGQAIVCENHGADWLPFRPLATLDGGAAKRTTREVVWLSPTSINRPLRNSKNSVTDIKRCLVCLSPIAQPLRAGRPRVTCSNACRQARYRA